MNLRFDKLRRELLASCVVPDLGLFSSQQATETSLVTSLTSRAMVLHVIGYHLGGYMI
jgi:hypothetical protein